MFFSALVAGKSKIEALEDLASGEDPLLVHGQLPFHRVLTWEKGVESSLGSLL